MARRIPRVDAATRTGAWLKGQSIELYGKTCGIIGLGAVGRRFAQIAAAIGMRTIAGRFIREPFPAWKWWLDELYRASDVISIIAALGSNHGFIGGREFGLMKKRRSW